MRKQRIDSTAEIQKAMTAKAVEPPINIALDDEDRVFFDGIIDEFAKSEWTAHQLELAAMLARTMADLNREQKTLREEGYVMTRPTGVDVENPRAKAVRALASDVLAMRRSLSLHARVKNGEPRDIAKRRATAKTAEADGSDFDDLLARPN